MIVKATAFIFFENHHLKLLFRLPLVLHSSITTKKETAQIQTKSDNTDLRTVLQKL
jgi:hypothetical protein